MAAGARFLLCMPWLLVLVSCAREGPLDPHGPIANSERLILFDATAIMLAVIVPVIVLTLVFAWWFRAENDRATYRPEWEYSGRIEMITWSIPALTIVFLGGVAWVSTHELDPPQPLAGARKALEVQVVSLDWQWLFIYPEQRIATLNDLTIPAATPVHFSLTSSSVMNSFFIPQLGSQIYTMAGMTTQLNLQADHEGNYQGLSAQFSGDGFSDMRFNVRALSEDRFRHWVEATKEKGGELDEPKLTALARPAHNTGSGSFADVAPDLFDAVSSGRWTMKPAGEAH